MSMEHFDVVVIGAGVVGAAVARELSLYELRVCVLEQEEDVCSGTSKANSGVLNVSTRSRTNDSPANAAYSPEWAAIAPSGICETVNMLSEVVLRAHLLGMPYPSTLMRSSKSCA